MIIHVYLTDNYKNNRVKYYIHRDSLDFFLYLKNKSIIL